MKKVLSIKRTQFQFVFDPLIRIFKNWAILSCNVHVSVLSNTRYRQAHVQRCLENGCTKKCLKISMKQKLAMSFF